VRTRLLVAAAAATDIPVRTGLASVMFAAGLPWGLSPAAWRERGRLGFYAELAQTHDPSLVFEKPREGVRIELSKPGPLSFRAPGGQVSLLGFDSPYVAVNPDMREHYAGFTRNAKAWAQHWRHHDGPRPTLGVIHGFGASPYMLNTAFFALPWLYSKGYDVLLYLLPFHGPRRDLLSAVNGSGLFAHGPSHFNEAMLQAVHDFRIFVDHLEAAGVQQVGVTGLSLGGYVSALLAAAEPRLRVVIPNAPVTSIPRLIPTYFPANVGVMMASIAHRTPLRLAEDATAIHSPLNYPSQVTRERLMIIGGRGDRLAPPEQSRLLWEHWDRPRLHWYPGNHLLHVNRAAYLREMRRFMAVVGFAP
jgi:pimeloyl-ACP methyl ester carboxylesterase